MTKKLVDRGSWWTEDRNIKPLSAALICRAAGPLMHEGLWLLQVVSPESRWTHPAEKLVEVGGQGSWWTNNQKIL